MIRAALALVLACAGAARAATWTCPNRTEIVTTTLVLVVCQASGTYAAGGDTVGGGGPGVELCNSENRFPTMVVPSSAASKTAGQGYGVLVGASFSRLVLTTAGSAPGAGVAFVEVADGTNIDGATFTALVNCK